MAPPFATSHLRRALNQGLGVCVLGLATIWSLSLHAPVAIALLAGLSTAAAASYAAARLRGRRSWSDRFVVLLSLLSILVAIAILVYDHYSRLSGGTVLLAGLTLLGGGLQLILAQRGWRDAGARALGAETAGASEFAGLGAALLVEPDGRVAACNEQAHRLFHCSEVELVGAPVDELLHGLPGARSFAELFAQTGTSSLPGPLELDARDPRGTCRPVEVAVSGVNEGSKLRTLVVRDISDRRRREEENRRLAAIIRSSDDAVLTKDLNGIITGWNQGAEHLYGYSAEETMGKSVDELILPPDRQAEANRIIREVGEGKTISFEGERITKSGTWIDVAIRAFPIRGLSGEVTAVCSVGHDVSDRRRRERAEAQEAKANLWRRRLRQALEEDTLVFHGQPVLEMSSGKVHHHELLVRMELDGNLILPGAFLPFAEKTELIRDLDLWAVERGMKLAAQLPVAINLSARSVGSRELLRAIEYRLGTDNSLARNLTFEITETAAAENLQGARELVWELTKMGCGVALDDFGTGYGSFTYLRHLPVTQLKIDSEFITGLQSGGADRRVVESMIAVARNFEMTTVAEGVETQETFERLEELGVDLVQGYYLGRPAPLDAERKRIHG